VGNLSKQVNDSQLNDLAVPFGKIVSANVATEKAGGASKGFGFVEFSTAEEGQAAIVGLHGKDVNGQTLNVNEAKPRKA
jgi:RNA recognition motif-containing protein